MPDIAAALERYRPIVDEWSAFMDAVRRPLPSCIWARPDRGDLSVALADDCLSGRSLDWFPGGIRLDEAPDLVHSLAYRAGLIHVLEEVSMLPVLLLDPRPGERILDLCAAPGNKTVLIAALMRGAGTVVANDASRGRQAVTQTAIHRMGLANVTLTAVTGAHNGWVGTGFDRVLVDAPCSCEGTVRKHPRSACRTDPEGRGKLAALQRRLLLSAVDACRPGGRIVYATCTFAPEENEEVVAHALAERGDQIRVVPVRIPGLPCSPGLTEWGGKSLPASLDHAIRIWPHQGDTGGFFCAVLERDGLPIPPRPPVADSDAVREAIAPIFDRFGMGRGVDDDFKFHRMSSRYVSATSADHAPGVPFPPLSRGLSAVRMTGIVPKLTTQGALALGYRATRNVIDLDRPNATAFVLRETVRADVDTAGYVLIRWSGHPIGVGFARTSGAAVPVDSLYPRTWAGLNPAGLRKDPS